MGSVGAANPLLTPVRVGAWQLEHRIVYAPLTRSRALEGITQPAAAEYYAQRATKGGLLISEATVVAPEGLGYLHTPGIFTKEQVEAWKPVVDAVHAKGATFLLQIWHCGRASHQDFQPDGAAPLSSSAVAIPNSQVITSKGRKDYPTPRAVDISEIPGLVEQYRLGARNAVDAGFDGVEIHGANGYLIDQFLKDSVNQRTDQYGGPIENRARFALEVISAVAEEIGPDRVGVRFAPFYVLGAFDSHKYALFTYVLEELNKLGLAYIHMIEPRSEGHDATASSNAVYDFRQSGQTLEVFRKAYTGIFLVAGGHTRESGIKALQTDHADLIVYGRTFLANPDLVKRFELDAPLNKYDRDTFYTQDQQVGYTDYPFLSQETIDSLTLRNPASGA